MTVPVSIKLCNILYKMPFNLHSYLFFKSNDLPVIGSDSGLNATVPVALEPDPTKECFFLFYFILKVNNL